MTESNLPEKVRKIGNKADVVELLLPNSLANITDITNSLADITNITKLVLLIFQHNPSTGEYS